MALIKFRSRPSLSLKYACIWPKFTAEHDDGDEFRWCDNFLPKNSQENFSSERAAVRALGTVGSMPNTIQFADELASL